MAAKAKKVTKKSSKKASKPAKKKASKKPARARKATTASHDVPEERDSRPPRCAACNGTGNVPGAAFEIPCPHCEGSGEA